MSQINAVDPSRMGQRLLLILHPKHFHPLTEQAFDLTMPEDCLMADPDWVRAVNHVRVDQLYDFYRDVRGVRTRRLIVEIDGASHNKRRQLRDEEKRRRLEIKHPDTELLVLYYQTYSKKLALEKANLIMVKVKTMVQRYGYSPMAPREGIPWTNTVRELGQRGP